MQGRIDTVSRIIATTPHTLYQSFMDPDSLVKWLPPPDMIGEIDAFQPEVGSGYRMSLTYQKAHAIPGKTSEDTDTFETVFVELVPDKKIVGKAVFDTQDPKAMGEMVSIWYFEEVAEGTKVTLIMENVPPAIPKEVHLEGLNSSLDNLEQFVQSE